MKNEKKLRKEILDKVREIYLLRESKCKFISGNTRVYPGLTPTMLQYIEKVVNAFFGERGLL